MYILIWVLITESLFFRFRFKFIAKQTFYFLLNSGLLVSFVLKI